MASSSSFVVMVMAIVLVVLATLTTADSDTDYGYVLITPLGSHDGELCNADRAFVFEDPDGTRILYDAGRTVRGSTDPRLGHIDVILLSHVHADHLGEKHAAEANSGTCAVPVFTVVDTPSSNTVQIAVAKNATIMVGSEMTSYFAAQVTKAGGSSSKVLSLRFGGTQKFNKVTFASVPAAHPNGLLPSFIPDAPSYLGANGLTVDMGPAGGYVIMFSNGLTAYLTGDTGISAEQANIGAYYSPQLAIVNHGGTPLGNGPIEAAYLVNDLVRPRAVIPSHANEQATIGGEVVNGSKTQVFLEHVRVAAYLPLSGEVMAFDNRGECVTCEDVSLGSTGVAVDVPRLFVSVGLVMAMMVAVLS